MKAACFLVLLISLSLVLDVHAGWKFWKKKDKDNSTTEATPVISSTQPSGLTQTLSSTQIPVGRITTPDSKNTNRLQTTADPSKPQGNIQTNFQQRRPNPGTEVGLDINQAKPGFPGKGNDKGQGYRDWAADLTGAGEPGRQPPKLPAQAPAIDLSQQNKRPSSVRPETVTSVPSGVRPASQSTQSLGQTEKSTLHVGTLKASTSTTTRTVLSTTATPAGNFHPTDGKSWAQVAAGGSRPNSPTPTPNMIRPNPSPTSTARPQYMQAGNNGKLPTQVTQSIGGGGIAGNSGQTVYSSNPIYSKGNTVTDEDLQKLTEALFIKDANNANKYITLNLQRKTSGSNLNDEAPQPLLSVKSEALQIPTIQKVLSIYDNYKLDTRENEYISPAQRQEESLLVDTFLSTNVMSTAMRFLADKGFIRQDYYEYKDALRRLWFNLYSRGDGKIGSSGFEHVFLTELKLGTEVTGLHNWIYFNAEEIKNRLNYLGYISKLDLGSKAALVKVHAKFNGVDKPVTSLFIGTSPELEMALYTVCFYARPDNLCPVSLGGTRFNVKTHKFRYRGKDLIGSAYPDI